MVGLPQADIAACFYRKLPCDALCTLTEPLLQPMSYVQIHVQLLWEKAPDMCHLIAELASGVQDEQCEFYRNEEAPTVRSYLHIDRRKRIRFSPGRLASLNITIMSSPWYFRFPTSVKTCSGEHVEECAFLLTVFSLTLNAAMSQITIRDRDAKIQVQHPTFALVLTQSLLQVDSGPPYGLLQGICKSLPEAPPKEVTTQIQCGPHLATATVADPAANLV